MATVWRERQHDDAVFFSKLNNWYWNMAVMVVLSSNISTGLADEHRTRAAKYFMKSRNVSAVIQADGWAVQVLPAGAPFNIVSLKYTRGNTKKGGKADPVAFTAQHIVTSEPLSADVILPTCFVPRPATTFVGFCTVVTPVSSILYMSLAQKWWPSSTLRRFSKKSETLFLLKVVERNKEYITCCN